MRHANGRSRPVSVFRGACALALAGAFALPAWAQGSAQAPECQVDPAWPKPLPSQWLIGQVGGLAVDKHDHIWVD